MVTSALHTFVHMSALANIHMSIQPNFECGADLCTVDSHTLSSSFNPVRSGSVVYDTTNSRYGVVVKFSTIDNPSVLSTSDLSSIIDEPGTSTADVGIARRYLGELLTHHNDRTSTPAVLVVDGKLMMFRRLICSVCMFSVNPFEHESRCHSTNSVRNAEVEDNIRRRAWLGDALHVMDVRRHLLSVNTPVVQLQVLAAQYISRSAQAQYYDLSVSVPGYTSPSYVATGTSESRRSAAFEASYCGNYRREYCQRVLSFVPTDFVFLDYDDLLD